MMETKPCRLCNTETPLGDFPHYNNGKRRGVHTICRSCYNRRGAGYKQAKRLADPAFYEREIFRNKEYRDRYSDGYRNHQLRKREKEKSLYHNDLFYRLTYICGAAKSRARKKGFDFELTPEILHVMIHVQNFKCSATGVPFDLTASDVYHKNPLAPSLDRKDSDKGYTLDNVQLVCAWYNMMKNEWSDADVKRFVYIAYHSMFED